MDMRKEKMLSDFHSERRPAGGRPFGKRGQAAPVLSVKHADMALAAKSGTDSPVTGKESGGRFVRNLGGTTGFSVPLFGVEKPYLFIRALCT